MKLAGRLEGVNAKGFYLLLYSIALRTLSQSTLKTILNTTSYIQFQHSLSAIMLLAFFLKNPVLGGHKLANNIDQNRQHPINGHWPYSFSFLLCCWSQEQTSECTDYVTHTFQTVIRSIRGQGHLKFQCHSILIVSPR
mgnify:CR=1 FL=1